MTGEQKEKLYNSMTAIDERFIEEAAEMEKNGENISRKKARDPRLALRLGLGIAAALAVAMVGIIFFTRILPENGTKDPSVSPEQAGQSGTEYKSADSKTDWPTKVVPEENADAEAARSTGDEITYIKRWDEKSFDEKYCYLDHEGRTYVNHAVEVPADRKGRCLVSDEAAYGFDPYAEDEETPRSIRTEVYEITGVSSKVAVAVDMVAPDARYLRAFVVSPSFPEEGMPATLGDLLTDWNLAEDLRIGTVYSYQDKNAWAQGYGTVCFDGADTAEVLRTLLKDTGTKRLEELPEGTERKILYGIAIYDDVLGIENLALSVYDGGWLWTNLTGHASIFKISEADAQAFLDYVYANLEGYVPVYEKDPDTPDEGIPENAPMETAVDYSNGTE